MSHAKTPDELLTILDKLGLATSTTTHEAHHSVTEAKQLRGAMQGQFTKNLFLKDKKSQLFLVTALEDQNINLKNLSTCLGVGRLSFAKAETLYENLKVEPGSVTPFALINDHANNVQPIFDMSMQGAKLLNFHPLTNTKTTCISYSDLLKFLVKTGHTPKSINFDTHTNGNQTHAPR